MNEEVIVEEVDEEKSTEEKSTDLVVRSFGAIVEHKSYGGKSLVENLHNADLAAKKVQYTAVSYTHLTLPTKRIV